MKQENQEVELTLYDKVENAIAPLGSVISLLTNTSDLYQLDKMQLDEVSSYYLVSHFSELGDVLWLATRTLKEILSDIRSIDPTEEEQDTEPATDYKCLGVL